MRDMEPLRLCLVHVQAALVQAFRDQGHRVLALHPEPGSVAHLPAELDRHGFTPDIVIQMELLAPRTLLTGLETIPARRVFWALDPHLNAFWQAHYVHLFDLVLSTQARNIPDLAPEPNQPGGPALVHMPWYAQERPFLPHAGRARLAGFVGRAGPERPVRLWLVEFLRALLAEQFEHVENIPFAEMLDFTAQTRIAPNESIAGEVNFRLFEAAGMGCLVLAQDLGAEQAALFEPGREILVCADALELVGNLRQLLARPRLAEAMGRAAWERCQREHLPGHRAQAILELALAQPRREYGPDSARRRFTLALAGLCEAGRTSQGGAVLARDLAGLCGASGQPAAADPTPADLAPALTTALLRVGHALEDSAGIVAALSRAEALEAAGQADAPLRLACSMLHLRRALDAPPEAGGDHMAQARLWAGRAGLACAPETTPVALLLAWAEEAKRQGLPARAGFGFDPERHLPASGVECLFLARSLEPANIEALTGLIDALRQTWGAGALLLAALSDLTLRRRGDWRAGLELGLCNLRCYRPMQGLDELALARRLAREQGQGEEFDRALAQADPSGRAARALAGQ